METSQSVDGAETQWAGGAAADGNCLSFSLSPYFLRMFLCGLYENDFGLSIEIWGLLDYLHGIWLSPEHRPQESKAEEHDGIVTALPWNFCLFWHTVFVEAKASTGACEGEVDSASQWEKYQNHSKKRMKVRRCYYCYFWKTWLSIGKNYVSFVFISLMPNSDQNEQMSNNLTNFQIEWLLSSLCVCMYVPIWTC